MSSPARPPLSRRTHVYVITVAILGFVTVALSVIDLLRQPVESHKDWLSLVAFTVISGWLSVKLPSVNASISISETFVFAGTLLYGPSVGVVLLVIDAAALCTKHGWVYGRLRWQQLLFNLSAPPLAIGCAAWLMGIHGPIKDFKLSFDFILLLGAFTAVYFLLSSWLVTLVVAFEEKSSPLRIWWTSFTELSVNFAAGASIAAFLVVNADGIDLTFIGVVLPLLLVIYFTYQWSLKHVEAERAKIHELNRVFLSTIEALALAIDAKDQVTHGHIRRVQRYTMALAEALGVRAQKDLEAIRAAALLHDTGKLAVPEYILNKPGPLTASEFERMKVHADVGADILKSIDFPYPVEPIVRHHHEKWDGTGYPKGLRGQEIPLGARILSVVDCYDALTSDRPYRPRMTRQQAEQELKDRRGTAYDPWIVDQFIKILDSLEQMDAAERRKTTSADGSNLAPVIPDQLDVISATNAEEREFNELRRELPRAEDITAATEILFKCMRRLVPVSSLTLYVPSNETNELMVAAAAGIGAQAIQGIRVPIGERISGWAFAHAQVVLNSDPTLELGPVARTFPVPLRYAAAVPIIDGKAVAVLVVYSNEPFERDHRRLVENSATLFAASLSLPIADRPITGEVGIAEPTGKPRIH